MNTHIQGALADASAALAALAADSQAAARIDQAAAMLIDAFANKRRVFSCGNGGSMCDAMHFAEELSGRFRADRRPLAATAISDPGHLTCTANDYGFDQVFSRYLEAHGAPGDVVVAFSTSGRSRNIVTAAMRSRELGLRVIGLTGRRDSPLAQHVDVEICTPAGSHSDRVQELHIKVVHIVIELVERALFPESYASPAEAP